MSDLLEFLEYLDYLDFMEFVDYATTRREPGPRRYLRDYSNPFEKYSAREFYTRYRFTPHGVKNKLLPLIQDDLKKPTNRGLPFPPEVMLLLTLRYFATGNVKKLGDVAGVCQPSRIVARVSRLLAMKMRDFVEFPSTAEDINKVKQKFYEEAHFPGVIGCIGCTDIKMKNPGGDSSETFRNKKGWFSLKVQAVTGPNLAFFDLVARWPGAAPDDLIFNKSVLKQRLSTGALKGILLGHSGYTVSNELMTPIPSPSSSSEEAYNEAHTRTRNTETAFRIWKKKFPCLLGMGIKRETVMTVICACATLHNISLMLDDTCDTDDDDNDDVVPVQENPNSNGFLVRQSLVNRYFTEPDI